jgi:hypothetical protein
MTSVTAVRLLASVRRSPARSLPDAALSAKARAALLRPLVYSAKSAPAMDPPPRRARFRRSPATPLDIAFHCALDWCGDSTNCGLIRVRAAWNVLLDGLKLKLEFAVLSNEW